MKAYEIWVKWFMATGQTVADLVNKQWSRSALKWKFHLFPAPEDAFAEPTNPWSSPLRCPIFVRLRTEIIPENKVLFGVPNLLCFQKSADFEMSNVAKPDFSVPNLIFEMRNFVKFIRNLMEN
jgi:hypothetical protein